jgi:hypothetical protein
VLISTLMNLQCIVHMAIAMGYFKHKSHMTPAARRPGRRRRGGFTLIETALTTVIVGTGVLAIVAAQQAYHIKNNWAQRTGTAMLLANELRELILSMPYHDPITGTANLGPETDEFSINGQGANAPDVRLFDDLDDFAGPVTGGVGAGLTFSPPINALRSTVLDMEQWSQTIVVENVLPDNISSTFAQPLATTDMMRVTVTVLYQKLNSTAPETVTSLTWVVTK